MAKIIQVLDVDPLGLEVRLDDGRIVHVKHNADAQVGAEFIEDPPVEPEPCAACAAKDARILELEWLTAEKQALLVAMSESRVAKDPADLAGNVAVPSIVSGGTADESAKTELE